MPENILNYASVLDNFSKPTPYFLVFIVLFLVIFIYGMNAGRGRMILMLLATYAAIVLTGLFPFRDYLLENIKTEAYFIDLGLFILAFLIVYIIFLNSSLRILAAKPRGSIFQILIFSVLILGIFLSHITVLLPAEILAKLDYKIFAYFKTSTAQFWWALAGIIGLAILKRKGE